MSDKQNYQADRVKIITRKTASWTSAANIQTLMTIIYIIMHIIISNFVNSSACFALLISSFLTRSQNGLKTQLLRKTWHVNQIFELILEQCVANYYGNNFLTFHD